jgi:hypothetical protein
MRQPGLFRLVLPIVVLGSIGLLHVYSLARLSELRYEQGRLERLLLEQRMRHGELMRQRSQLTSHSVLSAYAQEHGLVPAKAARPLQVGAVSPPKTYLNLPGESGTLPGSGTQRLGQLPMPEDLAPRGM